MSTVVSVDGAGRLVLPKRLREQFNLRPGSELEVAAFRDHLELKPLESLPPLQQKGALLVHQGSAQSPLSNAVRQLRKERTGRLSRGIQQ